MTRAFLDSMRTAMGCAPTPDEGTVRYRLLALPTFHAPVCVELALGPAPALRCVVLTDGSYELWAASRAGGEALDDAIVGAMYHSRESTRSIDRDQAERLARIADSLQAPKVDPADEAARDGVLAALEVLDARRVELVATVVGTSHSPSLRAWVDFLFEAVEPTVHDDLRSHLTAARSYF